METELYCVMSNEDGMEAFTSPEPFEVAKRTASRLKSGNVNVVAIVTEHYAKGRKDSGS